MHQLQIIVLQRDLIRIPLLDQVRTHLLAEQRALGRLVDLNACSVFVPDLGVSMDVIERILVGFQIIANDIGMGPGEFLVRRDNHVRRRAASLVRFVLSAQIGEDAISVLSESLDRFHSINQGRVDVTFIQQLK